MNKLFVVGYMVVGQEGCEDSNVAIKDDFEGAKALLVEYLEDEKERFDEEGDDATMSDMDTFFFMVEQEPNGCLTHFDPIGGTRGEIVLNGTHTMLFKFNEYEPTLGDINDAIEKVKGL